MVAYLAWVAALSMSGQTVPAEVHSRTDRTHGVVFGGVQPFAKQSFRLLGKFAYQGTVRVGSSELAFGVGVLLGVGEPAFDKYQYEGVSADAAFRAVLGVGRVDFFLGAGAEPRWVVGPLGDTPQFVVAALAGARVRTGGVAWTLEVRLGQHLVGMEVRREVRESPYEWFPDRSYRESAMPLEVGGQVGVSFL